MLGDYLHEFSVIVKSGSMSDAASKLGLSPSSLARHLAALETQLGTQLIERGPAGMRLTEDGAYAFDAAREISALGDELVRSLREGNAARRGRRIRIEGITDSTVASQSLEAARERLEDTGVRLSLRFAQSSTPPSIERALVTQEADIVLAYRATANLTDGAAGIRRADLFQTLCVAVVEQGHPLSARVSVRVDELRGFAFARIRSLANNSGALWDEFARACARHGFMPENRTVSHTDSPGFDRRYPEYITVYGADNPLVERLAASGRAVVPIVDTYLEVLALTRTGDETANHLVDEARKTLGTSS